MIRSETFRPLSMNAFGSKTPLAGHIAVQSRAKRLNDQLAICADAGPRPLRQTGRRPLQEPRPEFFALTTAKGASFGKISQRRSLDSEFL